MSNFEENEILVSIICNTYNHEKYISNAIESFLMQKTNFRYEILIHDDASTDKTAEIIRNYEGKYPDIIKPIYQLENQYSKGISVGRINRERALGKYYAICEGDDYWTDQLKLQKQIEILENNSDFSGCVHGAFLINAQTNKKIGEIRPSKRNRTFNIEEIIEGGGGLFPTNSIVYRANKNSIRPDFYYKNKYTFGDYQLMILLALMGKVYYVNESMSAYRYNVPGSWTSTYLSDNQSKSKHIKELNSLLEEVNKYTKFNYDETIKKTKLKNEFYLAADQGNLNELKSEKYINYYNSLSIQKKIGVYFRTKYPRIYKRLLAIRRMLK